MLVGVDGWWWVLAGGVRCWWWVLAGGGGCWQVLSGVCGGWWRVLAGGGCCVWVVVGVGVWWALACGGCQQMADGGGWLQVLENLGLTESCPVVELNPVQPGHVLVQPYQFFSRKTSQINSKKRI